MRILSEAAARELNSTTKDSPKRQKITGVTKNGDGSKTWCSHNQFCNTDLFGKKGGVLNKTCSVHTKKQYENVRKAREVKRKEKARLDPSAINPGEETTPSKQSELLSKTKELKTQVDLLYSMINGQRDQTMVLNDHPQTEWAVVQTAIEKSQHQVTLAQNELTKKKRSETNQSLPLQQL